MTIERLDQYRDLQQEVQILEVRLSHARQKASRVETDVVEGSSPYFPYVKHPITVSGTNPRCTARANRILRLYKARSDQAMRQLEEIEIWLLTVTDSTVRLLVELYYVEGRTWRAASRRVFGRACEDTARMRVKRYFEKKL